MNENSRDAKEAEIRCLKSDLLNGEIGDWKLLKIQEARMTGGEDPYDLEELIAARNAARARINELEREIAEM